MNRVGEAFYAAGIVRAQRCEHDHDLYPWCSINRHRCRESIGLKLGHDRERIKGHDGACPSSYIARDVSATLNMTNHVRRSRSARLRPPLQMLCRSRLRKRSRAGKRRLQGQNTTATTDEKESAWLKDSRSRIARDVSFFGSAALRSE